MKTKSLIIVAGMLAFAGVTLAEEAKEKPKKEPKPLAPEILEKYDTDKDGKLNKEEKAAWTKDKKANQPKKEPKPIDPAILEKYDADKDGKLNKDEKAAWKKDQPKPEKKPKPAKKEKDKPENTEDFGE